MLILGKLYDPDWDPKNTNKGTAVEAQDDSRNDGEERGESKKKVISKEAKASYLEFISFMISERYSFEQIVRLGDYMKERLTQMKKSLKEIIWDSEVIRKLTVDCVAKDLKDSLFEELEASPFSLSLYTATLMGDQIVVIRARYLKNEYDPVLMMNIRRIQNHILAVEELEMSTTGKTFYEILIRKVLTNDKLKENFIGLCHDGASNLSGEGIGLVGQLRKNVKASFFDLHDPCHCYNLALEDALEILPKEVLRFIEKIHSHFNHYIGRSIHLNRIQQKNNLRVLGVKKYAATRWLSIGESTERLIYI